MSLTKYATLIGRSNTISFVKLSTTGNLLDYEVIYGNKADVSLAEIDLYAYLFDTFEQAKHFLSFYEQVELDNITSPT